MTLFTDPLRWTKAAAGSGWGLGVLIGAHIILFGVTGKALYDAGMSFLMVPIFLIGIAFPFMYLYALRRLSMLIDSKDQKE